MGMSEGKPGKTGPACGVLAVGFLFILAVGAVVTVSVAWA